MPKKGLQNKKDLTCKVKIINYYWYQIKKKINWFVAYFHQKWKIDLKISKTIKKPKYKKKNFAV